MPVLEVTARTIKRTPPPTRRPPRRSAQAPPKVRPRPNRSACTHAKAQKITSQTGGIRAIGLSPGTVATQMQREIKASGINPVSELAWEDHIPADWPARALLWMCSAEADKYCGEEISLRDEGIRKAIGLV